MLERSLKLKCLAFWDPIFEVYKSVVYNLIPLNAGDWKHLFVIGYDHVPFFYSFQRIGCPAVNLVIKRFSMMDRVFNGLL